MPQLRPGGHRRPPRPPHKVDFDAANMNGITISNTHMEEFYQARKSGRVVKVSVVGKQVPLYGAGANLHNKPNNGRLGPVVVPVRLAFVLRARAHILSLLLRSKFYRRVACRLELHEAHLGKPVRVLTTHCEYHDGRPDFLLLSTDLDGLRYGAAKLGQRPCRV